MTALKYVAPDNVAPIATSTDSMATRVLWWRVCGWVLILCATLLTACPRYEWRVVPGAGFYKIDHWTGRVTRIPAER